MKQKVVWCISKYALPPRLGAQGRLFFLSDEFEKRGFKSYVITSSTNHLTKEMPRQIERVHVHKVGQGDAVFLRGIYIDSSVSFKRVLSWLVFEWRLLNLILFRKGRIEKPDIIIVSSLSLITVLNGYLAKLIYKSRFFFEIRDIWPLSAVSVTGFSKNNPLIMLMRMVEKFGYRNADVITSPIPNLKQHVSESIKKPFKFCYIPQGFDPAFMSKQEMLLPEFKQKYIPKNKFIVGYIGNIVLAYNLDMMLRCARVLQVSNPDIHFLVLGDGTYKAALMESAKDLSNITFIPRIPKSEVQDFLSHCDVVTNFFLPENAFRFGISPQKLVDYMYASRPVLMSFSGYKSIVEDSQCGLTVPADDVEAFNTALLVMKSYSKDELVSMGKRGKDFLLTRLAWSTLANQYIELF
ncbi:MAG: glycosyltransferase family 4 protein [Chitinophagaceae bacterium]